MVPFKGLNQSSEFSINIPMLQIPLKIPKSGIRKKHTTRGIASLEYMVFFAMAVSLFCFACGPNGVFQGSFGDVLASVSTQMTNMADQGSWTGISEKSSFESGFGSGTGSSGSSGSSGNSGGSGSSGSSGSSGTSGSSGSSGGGSGGSGGGGGISVGGGGVGGGTTVITIGGGTSGTSGDGSSGGSSGPWIISANQHPVTYAPNILTALNKLNGTVNGQYYYDLIQSNNIGVEYVDMAAYGAGATTLGFWYPLLNPLFDNTIHINEQLADLVPASAIASIICHEATHADYSYNAEDRIAQTLDAHPELTRDDLNIYRIGGEEYSISIQNPETGDYYTSVQLGNSVDQEYNAFSQAVLLWNEIKGFDESFMDDEAALYAAGEGVFKEDIRWRYEEDGLPEY